MIHSMLRAGKVNAPLSVVSLLCPVLPDAASTMGGGGES